MPSKFVAKTPYELWIGRRPNLSKLRPRGSDAYVNQPSHGYGKMGARGKKCIFIRYSENSKAYVFIGGNEDYSSVRLSQGMQHS